MSAPSDGGRQRGAGLVRWVIRAVVAKTERESLSAEIDAGFARRARDGEDRFGAARWYAAQLLGVLSPRVLWRLAIEPRLRPVTGPGPARALARIGGHVRQGVRSVVRQRRFAATTGVILGLGIGAATTLFSVLDAILLQPLPHPEADRLVTIVSPVLDPATIEDWRSSIRELDGLAGHSIAGATARTASGGERVRLMPVTRDFFALLLDAPRDGRLLGVLDHDPGAPPVVVVARPFWERHFGVEWRPGETIEIDARVFEIVGTVPSSFQYRTYRDIDVWSPLPETDRRVSGVGRLAAGIGPDRLSDALEARAVGLVRERGLELRPDQPAVRVVALKEATVDDVRTVLWLLFGATALVLLLACANAANLFVARLLDRHGELAVRVALGAGPGGILGILLSEGVLVAVASTGLGLGLAALACTVLEGPIAVALPRAYDLAIDGRVVAFSAAATLLTVAAFAFGPAIAASRRTTIVPGSSRFRSTFGPRAKLVRSGLVVCQVALALVLTVSATLLVRAFLVLNPTDPGFAVDERYVAAFDLPADTYSEPERALAFAEAFRRELDREPEVLGSSVVYYLPLTGLSAAVQLGSVDGRAPSTPLLVHFRGITQGFFELMEMPLLRGRAIGELAPDLASAVVNEAAVRRLWPDGSAIGRRFTLPVGPEGEERTFSVVGVVGDTRIFGSDTRDRPVAYLSFPAVPETRFQVVFAVSPGVSLSRERVEAAVASVDAGVPLEEYGRLSSLIATSVRLPRFQASVMSALGTLALLMAAAGCFAVLSYLVAARRREIGIRLALGATNTRVVGFVVRHGARLVLVGLAVGLLACLAVTRLLSAVLYEVSPLDPLSFVAAIATLGASAAVSLFWPALRATGVSPSEVLQEE